MDVSTALLGFANLLEIAHLSSPGDSYRKQEELLRHCRATRKAFLATMPVRHRYKCEVCGIEEGEAWVHLEDPTQQLATSAWQRMEYLECWSTPVGLFVDLHRSELHHIAVHGAEASREFVTLLSEVRR